MARLRTGWPNPYARHIPVSLPKQIKTYRKRFLDRVTFLQVTRTMKQWAEPHASCIGGCEPNYLN